MMSGNNAGVNSAKIIFCDMRCQYASFPKENAVDGAGSCRTFAALWCEKLQEYVTGINPNKFVGVFTEEEIAFILDVCFDKKLISGERKDVHRFINWWFSTPGSDDPSMNRLRNLSKKFPKSSATEGVQEKLQLIVNQAIDATKKAKKAEEAKKTKSATSN